MKTETDEKKLIRFGQIRRHERFLYMGEEWIRINGATAMRVNFIGTGHVGWPMSVNTMVEPLALTR